MTTYTTPKGDQVVICNHCGCDVQSGKPADLPKLTPLDQSAEVRAYLLKQGATDANLKGCTLSFKDTCPTCMAKGEGARL